MAYITDEKCYKCEQITVHTNGRCNGCAIREVETERLRWSRLTSVEQVQELLLRVEKLERRTNGLH